MSKPRIVVDRIEGAFAVLEVAGAHVEIPAVLLPAGAGEGTVLVFRVQAEAVPGELAERLDRLQAESGIEDDFSF